MVLSKRRSLLKLLSGFLVVGTTLRLDSFVDFILQDETKLFPIVVKIRYYPPINSVLKTAAQIRADIKSWGNEPAYNRMASAFQSRQQMSWATKYTEYSKYHEFIHSFSSLASYKEFCSALQMHGAVQYLRQKQLGYQIECHIEDFSAQNQTPTLLG